jgi:hypothetical protein
MEESSGYLEKVIAREHLLASKPKPFSTTAPDERNMHKQQQFEVQKKMHKEEQERRSGRAKHSLASLYLSDKYIVLNRKFKKPSYFDSLIDDLSEQENICQGNQNPTSSSLSRQPRGEPRRRERHAPNMLNTSTLFDQQEEHGYEYSHDEESMFEAEYTGPRHPHNSSREEKRLTGSVRMTHTLSSESSRQPPAAEKETVSLDMANRLLKNCWHRMVRAFF